MSDALSRRTLLTAAAGLVVGAGAGVGVTAGDSSAPARPPKADPPPGEVLMVEHGVLKRILLAYRAAHDQLVAGQQIPLGAITDAAGIVGDYVESFHEGLEEAYVFPRVAPTEPALITTLITQHDRGRHLTQQISDISSIPLTTASRATLVASLAAFVRMYEPHEAREDTVVFPTLRQVSSQRTLDELTERFADLSNKAYGDDAVATMLARVDGIEEQFGINDLASFTPTGVN